jgi:hypothetical protein
MKVYGFEWNTNEVCIGDMNEQMYIICIQL